jgi:hypothetical protein
MRRRVVLAALALLAAWCAVRPASAQEAVGKPAKTFPATAVLGMARTKDPLVALRGRVVLLVFFATHYEKCAEIVPEVNKLLDRLGPKGLSSLWVTEEEKAPVEEWLAKTSLAAGVALLDTPTRDELNRHYPVPGYPTAFLVDAAGVVVWTGHPGYLKDAEVAPHLEKTSVPPVLPKSLAEAQALLDEGRWAAARTSLLAAADGGKLDKRDAGWARGTAGWIERRRPRVLDEAAALAAKKWWWDAWAVYDDYPRRFEGLEGIDVANAGAAEIRGNADAKLDLQWGDDFAKAKAYLAAGKPSPAKLILERLSKLTTTRFADRARELLKTVK